MGRPNILLLIIMLLFVSCGPGNCLEETHYIQKTGVGMINWTDAIITATGAGTPPDNAETSRPVAVREANVAAYRNLIQTVKRVRIDDQMTVEDAMKNDELAGQIEDMIRRANVEDIKYLSDGTVTVTLQMGMRESFASLLLPQYLQQFEAVKVLNPPKNEPEENRPSYSGLLVDARDLEFQPAMCIRIVDEQLQNCYTPYYASREYAVQRGMCGYMRNMAAALKEKRLGPSPLVVKGIKVEGKSNATIVISNADARLLRRFARNYRFLKECRVVVVMP